MSTTWVTPAVTTPGRRLPGRNVTGPARAGALAGLVMVAGLAASQRVRGRRLTRQLQDMSARLEQHRRVERERVHDARSAAAAIAGAAHLLRRGTTGADPDELYGLLVDEAQRLQRVFDVEPAESVHDFDVHTVLEHAARCARISGTPVIVADPARVSAVGRQDELATVLANLLTNVRRHAPGAGVVLHARRRDRSIVLTVDDDGPGIPAAARNRVLQRGERGTSGAPGEGLGLYTAATTLQRRGGTLRLTARPGGGTRVTITLPAAADPRRHTVRSAAPRSAALAS